MYVRQVLASLLVGGILGYAALISGFIITSAVAAAVLSYLGVRWVWATIARTRYWLSRGTEGVYQESCPNCQRQRYRVSGDWILTCHKCGWKPGWPVIRWVTRSVPGVQFRRSLSQPGAFVAGVSITVLLYAPSQSTGSSSPSLPSISWGGGNLPSVEQVAIFGIAILLLIVMILWALRPRQYYCKNCGQDLGRGDPLDHCPKCGSNRFTNEDPGVGEKVRVERVE